MFSRSPRSNPNSPYALLTLTGFFKEREDHGHLKALSSEVQCRWYADVIIKDPKILEDPSMRAALISDCRALLKIRGNGSDVFCFANAICPTICDVAEKLDSKVFLRFMKAIGAIFRDAVDSNLKSQKSAIGGIDSKLKYRFELDTFQKAQIDRMSDFAAQVRCSNLNPAVNPDFKKLGFNKGTWGRLVAKLESRQDSIAKKLQEYEVLRAEMLSGEIVQSGAII